MTLHPCESQCVECGLITLNSITHSVGKEHIRFVGEGTCDICDANGEMEPSSSQNGTEVLLFTA